MSASRKLQATIDVTLKKVDEGIDEFQQVWRKVEESQNQNQRVSWIDLESADPCFCCRRKIKLI